MREVRKRLRGHTRLTSKHQATIPVDVLKKTGVQAGDELRVRAAGPGRIVLERVSDPIERFAGAMPEGVYYPGYLDELRAEWERRP